MGNSSSCLHLGHASAYGSSAEPTKQVSTKMPASPPVQSMGDPTPTSDIPSVTRGANAEERQKHSYSPASTSRFSFSSFFHPAQHPVLKEPPTPFSLASSPSFSHLRIDTDAAEPVVHKDHRQKWLNSTPSSHSRLALQFPHYCPLCMRYFQSIYSTSCCAHNICLDCTERYIASKLPAYLPLSFVPTIPLPLACPHCTQTTTPVAFALVKEDGVESSVSESNSLSSRRRRREYVESPRTRAALARLERRKEEEVKHVQQQPQPQQPAVAEAPILLIDLLANVNRSSSSSVLDVDPLNIVTQANPIRVMA